MAGDRAMTGRAGKWRGKALAGRERHGAGARSALLLPVLLLGLAACSLQRDSLARGSVMELVGLTANDLKLCAGIPDRTSKGTHGAEFWSYERSVAPGGSISSPYGGFSLSGREECRATFELSGDRVTRLAFSRVAGSETGHFAPCSPIIEACSGLLAQGSVRVIRAEPELATAGEEGAR